MKTLSVMLRKDVPDLGKVGDVKVVASGYARNFLFPQQLAMVSTPGSVKALELERRRMAKEHEKLTGEAKVLAKKLDGMSLTIKRSAGDQGKLFGSVTSSDIAAALAHEGVKVDKRIIHLDEPVKTLGAYTVPVRLHQGIEAKVKVWVVKE